MRFRNLIATLIVAVLASHPAAFAQTYVETERDGLVAALPPVPPPGSLSALVDLETVLMLQAIRTPELEAEAAADAERGGLDWATLQLGESFSETATPLAWALFDRVRRDATLAGTRVKELGPQRPRPQAADPRVRPSLPLGGHAANAWPSARAASSRIWAGILGDLFPERAAALRAAADRTGWLRVIGGVHYPSDLIAAHAMADRFLAVVRADPRYQAELAAARAELSARGAGR